MQFAASQHGFEQVARVHGAFGLARAHDGVQLIDEEDNLAFALFHFIEDGLQTLFKLAAILGTGNQRAHVQREQLVAAQAFRHVALDDTEGQTFHNGRLAHAGFADEHGVVLRAPRKNTHHAPDFRITADNRVHLALTRRFHQVAGILAQGLERIFRRGARHTRAAAHAFHGLGKGSARDLVFLEDLAQRRGRRRIAQRGKKMVNADVLVLHPPRFLLGLAKNGSQAAGDHDLLRIDARAGYRGTAAQLFFYGYAQRARLHAHLLKDTGDDTFFLPHKGKSKVLHVRFLMAHADGDALRLGNGLAGFFCKFVDIHKEPPLTHSVIASSVSEFLPVSEISCIHSL